MIKYIKCLKCKKKILSKFHTKPKSSYECIRCNLRYIFFFNNGKYISIRCRQTNKTLAISNGKCILIWFHGDTSGDTINIAIKPKQLITDSDYRELLYKMYYFYNLHYSNQHLS